MDENISTRLLKLVHTATGRVVPEFGDVLDIHGLHDLFEAVYEECEHSKQPAAIEFNKCCK